MDRREKAGEGGVLMGAVYYRGRQRNESGFAKDEDQGYTNRGGSTFEDVETGGGFEWKLGKELDAICLMDKFRGWRVVDEPEVLRCGFRGRI